MNDLIIEKTQSTPYIHLSETRNLLEIRGESFPENAAKFYTPIVAWIREYLDKLDDIKVTLEFEVVYFNSSTSKIFMIIFDEMNELAKQGKNIYVNWICDEENETAIECGEEFKEDLTDLSFNINLIEG